MEKIDTTQYIHSDFKDAKEEGSQDDLITDIDPREQRRIIHRVDRRLVTLTGLMYCVSLMDRTNLSLAAIAGMLTDLKLVGNNHYNIISLVFFITYFLFQIPSTVVVREVGPRLHLGTITLLWGCCMIGMGFVKSWNVMAGLRVVLGMLEAGFFPSCVYLLSTWYTRYEVHKRYSVFYMLGAVASAFSGILAYGIMQLGGRDNLAGWRWIFIVEGLITVFLAICGYIFLVGFPDTINPKKTWHFLNEREIQFIIDRVEADRADAHAEPFNLKKYLASGLDPKIWGFAMIFLDTTTITYAMAYFLPIILRDGMGFTVGQAECLVAPPYALGAVVMYVTGWIGDKYKIRGPIVVFNMIIVIIGLAVMGWVKSVAARYFGVFLVAAGANANVPATLAYQANNIRGQWKRAFCSATLVGFGALGGIAGTLIFRDQDAPHYYNGMYGCITCCLLNIILVGVLDLKFKYSNDRQKQGKCIIEGEEGFRYTY